MLMGADVSQAASAAQLPPRPRLVRRADRLRSVATLQAYGDAWRACPSALQFVVRRCFDAFWRRPSWVGRLHHQGHRLDAHELDCERFFHDPERDLAFNKGDIIIGTNTRGNWFEGYLEKDPSKTVRKFPSTFVTRLFADSGKRWLCVTLFECEGLTKMDLTGNDVYVRAPLCLRGRSTAPARVRARCGHDISMISA